MKRVVVFIMLFIVTVVSMFLFANIANAKVNVYMITKEGCSGCEAAYEYFDKLKEENPDLFELIPFEVFNSKWGWNSDDLKTLFMKTYEYFGEDSSKASTPTIVIGDYYTLGLPTDESIVYNKILEADKNGKDVMVEIAKENDLDIDELKYDRTKKDEESTSGKYDTIIVVGIFVVLIGGFIVLVKASKK